MSLRRRSAGARARRGRRRREARRARASQCHPAATGNTGRRACAPHVGQAPGAAQSCRCHRRSAGSPTVRLVPWPARVPRVRASCLRGARAPSLSVFGPSRPGGQRGAHRRPGARPRRPARAAAPLRQLSRARATCGATSSGDRRVIEASRRPPASARRCGASRDAGTAKPAATSVALVLHGLFLNLLAGLLDVLARALHRVARRQRQRGEGQRPRAAKRFSQSWNHLVEWIIGITAMESTPTTSTPMWAASAVPCGHRGAQAHAAERAVPHRQARKSCPSWQHLPAAASSASRGPRRVADGSLPPDRIELTAPRSLSTCPATPTPCTWTSSPPNQADTASRLIAKQRKPEPDLELRRIHGCGPKGSSRTAR